MPLGMALSCIDQLKKIPTIGKIGLTGGEPFLLYPEVLEICRHASCKGLIVSCITNGYWARSEEETLAKMRELRAAGLATLYVSTDTFHQAFVPVESVRRILRAGRRVGLFVGVYMDVTRQSMRLPDLFEALKEEMVESAIFESPLFPVGRAQETLDAEDFFTRPGIPAEPCLRMNDLFVVPSGDVYPCCSAAGMQPPLRLGNVHETLLAQIAARLQRSFFHRLLAQRGPGWFAQALIERELIPSLQPAYVHACHLCYDLFSRPEWAAAVATLVEEEEIRRARRLLEAALLSQTEATHAAE